MKKRKTNRILVFVAIALAAFALLGSCSDEEEEQKEEEQARILTLQMDQQVVVPTSKVRVTLGGTRRVEANVAEVTIVGEIGERSIDETFEQGLQRAGDVGDLYVELSASEVLWPKLEPGASGRFSGDLQVVLGDVLGNERRGRLDDISWRFEEELRPEVELDVPGQIFANSSVRVDGAGILRPEEGQTQAVIGEGEFVADAGHIFDLDGEVLPVEWTGDRERGELRFDPAVIGVHPGQLEATIRFENHFADGTTLQETAGERNIVTSLDTTFIAGITPEKASRGQLVELQGRGFVPPPSDEGYGMWLRFEGTLTPSDPEADPHTFEGSSAAMGEPWKVVSDEEILQDVWYRVEGRTLHGLGAAPGTFDGTITPVLYDAHGEVQGLSWQGEFEVLPTKQMVYLKFLPSFTTALDRYGLVNVEREIRDRILEVVHRDYAGINIEFVDHPPQDFAAYATVEIGGPDPTGNQAFGFDNTYHDQPKDTGNLHIDDYLGGINPETGEAFNNPYGGIFVESFAAFSPTIHPEMGHASERFDDIFGPFMPELGGERVRATEWPEGDRVDEIEEAIRVFANVVGNTTSHEMGHAMGLAYFEGDWDQPGMRYHNLAGNGYIMDAGIERSFEQRAELDGEGPETFSPENRAYLEEILPLE